MTGSLSHFDRLFLKSKNQVGLSVVLLLAWIAAADGEISAEENQALRTVAGTHNTPGEVDIILGVAREGRVEDLQLACEVVSHMAEAERRLLLQMAVGVSLEDGYLVTGENHILRFIADLMLLGEEGLNEVFREMTGHDYPEPSDVSRVDWWQARERRARARGEERRGREEAAGRNRRTESETLWENGAGIQRLKDLAALGLDEDATPEEIRAAYRRMAQVHHPDKFSSLGSEAVAAAERTFRRILAAYERLIGI